MMDVARARHSWRHDKQGGKAKLDTETAALTLKEARKRAGLGREKCARLSGVNKVLILRYENGKAIPGLVSAAKLARVLGVQLHEIREFPMPWRRPRLRG